VNATKPAAKATIVIQIVALVKISPVLIAN
jgi:hypothetical protein